MATECVAQLIVIRHCDWTMKEGSVLHFLLVFLSGISTHEFKRTCSSC